MRTMATSARHERRTVAEQTNAKCPPLEQARSRFNDYGPLLRLKRYDEARKLLLGCRAVFEEENAVGELGPIFSALADLEDE